MLSMSSWQLISSAKLYQKSREASGLPEASIDEIANAGDNRGMHAVECRKEPVAFLLVAPEEEIEIGRFQGVCHVCHGA